MIYRIQIMVEEYNKITEPDPTDTNHGIHIRRRIRDEVYDWMDKFEVWHEYQPNIYGYRTSWLTFRNKNDWMLFKLTWL